MLSAARHLLAQRRVLAALGGTVTEAAATRLGFIQPPAPEAVVVPGPEIVAEVPAPPPALVRAYLRHVGGDVGAYRDRLPAHLFPQWTVPIAARVLRGLPYPMLRVVNAGCRLEIRAPLPAGLPLVVRAQLAAREDDGRRVLLRQRIVTGTTAAPDALVIDLNVIVPLAQKQGRGGARSPARVPDDARELATLRLPADAGLTFGLLTGDVNPLHWARPYARAAGFRSPILHGFSTMARAMEGIIRHVYAGAVDRLGGIDVRFARPLALPARVGLYRRQGENDEIYVGDAPSGPAYLNGTFWGSST